MKYFLSESVLQVKNVLLDYNVTEIIKLCVLFKCDV